MSVLQIIHCCPGPFPLTSNDIPHMTDVHHDCSAELTNEQFEVFYDAVKNNAFSTVKNTLNGKCNCILKQLVLGNGGRSPLAEAIFLNQIPMLKLLAAIGREFLNSALTYPAQIAEVVGHSRGYPLSLAIRRQNLKAVKILTANGAKAAYEHPSNMQPIKIAVELRASAIFRYLMSKGEVTTANYMYNVLFLSEIRRRENLATVEFMIANGVKLQKYKGKDGLILSSAVRGGAEMLSFFISHGFSPIGAKHDGLTPLQHTVARGFFEESWRHLMQFASVVERRDSYRILASHHHSLARNDLMFAAFERLVAIELSEEERKIENEMLAQIDATLKPAEEAILSVTTEADVERLRNDNMGMNIRLVAVKQWSRFGQHTSSTINWLFNKTLDCAAADDIEFFMIYARELVRWLSLDLEPLDYDCVEMLSKLRKLLVAKAATAHTVAEANLVLPRILWIRDVIYHFIDRRMMVSRKFKPIDTDPNDLHYGEFRRLRELVYCVMTAEFVAYRLQSALRHAHPLPIGRIPDSSLDQTIVTYLSHPCCQPLLSFRRLVSLLHNENICVSPLTMAYQQIVECPDYTSRTEFRFDCVDVVASLLGDVALPVNAIDPFGNTALHYAIRVLTLTSSQKCAQVVRYLLEKGANLHVRGGYRLTALEMLQQGVPRWESFDIPLVKFITLRGLARNAVSRETNVLFRNGQIPADNGRYVEFY